MIGTYQPRPYYNAHCLAALEIKVLGYAPSDRDFKR